MSWWGSGRVRPELDDGNHNGKGLLKIALICDWFLPRFGGLELQLRDLALRLQTAGHEVHVISGFPGEPEVDGVRVHRLDSARFPQYGFVCSPAALSSMRRILRAERFEVLHVHFSYIAPTAFLGIRLGHTLGIPTVVTFHSFLGNFGRTLRLANAVTGWSRWPDTVTAVSRTIAREVRPLFPDVDMPLLPNGIDPKAWRPNGEVWRDVSGVLQLISIMRLKVRKRARALVRIAAALRDRLGDDAFFRLTIVGDGPERVPLERMIARLRLERFVDLKGLLTRPQILELFAESHVFVLPSVLESFGISALEARWAGLPIVVRADTGAAEFVHEGVNGFAARSDAEMVDVLFRLATQPALLGGVVESARAEPPQGFDWPTVVDRHLEIYASTLRRHAERGRTGRD